MTRDLPQFVTDRCWADETDGVPCDTLVPREGDGLCDRHRNRIRNPDFDRRQLLQRVFVRGPA